MEPYSIHEWFLECCPFNYMKYSEQWELYCFVDWNVFVIASSFKVWSIILHIESLIINSLFLLRMNNQCCSLHNWIMKWYALRRILCVFFPFPHLTCTAFQGSKLVASETMEIESAGCLTLLRIPRYLGNNKRVIIYHLLCKSI